MLGHFQSSNFALFLGDGCGGGGTDLNLDRFVVCCLLNPVQELGHRDKDSRPVAEKKIFNKGKPKAIVRNRADTKFN